MTEREPISTLFPYTTLFYHRQTRGASRRSGRSFTAPDVGKGGATMKYWVNVPVQVTGYHGDLGDNIDLVVEQLVKLDACNPALLDFSADRSEEHTSGLQSL